MDSEKFFGELRDAVNLTRVAGRALEETRPQTAENLRAVIDQRRHRDMLTSLIARHPEEFAGLVVALAAQVHDLNNRVEYLLTGQVQS